MHDLGQTRSANRRDHLLLTPDTFVRIPLPGLERGVAIVHVSPAAGAAFTQYTVELEVGGTFAPAITQRFVYVLSGAVDLASDTSFNSLAEGGYAYLPSGSNYTIAGRTEARLAIIEKPYEELPGVAAPQMLIGNEAEVASAALMGDEDLQVRAMLPEAEAFDFAVNTMTYQPGAGLSMVEIHVMEHGLLMLQGGGIYRLGDAWYATKAGDFIWMAPYCPQWFGAIGKQPAKYLIYKDWNRPPL